VEILGNSPVYWTDKIQLCFEGAIMEDYESQYEEYKKSLLQSHYFRTKLIDEYKNTMYAEGDYIDENGVLDKITVLSAACGVCYALSFSLVQLDEFPGILIRAVLAIVGTICFIWARIIGSKFKDSSGKSSFYSFRYSGYIEDRVNSDKEMETRNLIRDMLDRQIDIDEFRKRFEELSKYDRFSEDLKNDCDLKELLL
jgi:hypothetical protein